MTLKKKSARTAEQEFLDAYSPEDFERPSVAVDLVLLSVVEDELCTFVVRRTTHPHLGQWALPGGFVGTEESIEEAVERVLSTKVGLSKVFFEQLYTFGSVRRDPRMRVISVSYFALIPSERFQTIKALSDDAILAHIVVPWQGLEGGAVQLVGAERRQRLVIAFDHAEIIGMAVKRLRGKLDYTPIGFELLPRTFTLLKLQTVHETILGRKVNKDSFRRRMLSSPELVATDRIEKNVDHRPATLYRFVGKAG